jgi:hypothetical protein
MEKVVVMASEGSVFRRCGCGDPAGLISDNPAVRAELPRARRPRAVVWTPYRVGQWRRSGERPPVAVWTTVQTATFLTSIRQHRLYAAYHLIALRGLRRGEAAWLR